MSRTPPAKRQRTGESQERLQDGALTQQELRNLGKSSQEIEALAEHAGLSQRQLVDLSEQAGVELHELKPLADKAGLTPEELARIVVNSTGSAKHLSFAEEALCKRCKRLEDCKDEKEKIEKVAQLMSFVGTNKQDGDYNQGIQFINTLYTKLHGKEEEDDDVGAQYDRQLKLLGPSNNGKTMLAGLMAELFVACADEEGGYFCEKEVEMTTMKAHLWAAQDHGENVVWGPFRLLWELAMCFPKRRYALVLNESNRGSLFNILNAVWWEKRRKQEAPPNLAILFTENPESEGYSVVGTHDPALSTRITAASGAVLDVNGGTFGKEEYAHHTTGMVGKHYWEVHGGGFYNEITEDPKHKEKDDIVKVVRDGESTLPAGQQVEELKRYFSRYRWQAIEKVVGKDKMEILQQGDQFTGTLGLNKNKSINDEGCIILAIALKRMIALNVLNLQSNQIGDNGMIHLSKALPEMIALNVLYLSDNQIGDNGMIHLSKALPKMIALNVLNLQSNQIGDNGMIHLSKAVPMMIALNHLYLSSNQIGKKGLVSITNAVNNGIALETLHLCDNSFSLNDNEAKELEKAWKAKGKEMGVNGLWLEV